MSLSSNLRAVDIHACREATGVQGVLLLLLLSLHVVDSDPLSVLEQEHRHLDHKMVQILFSAKRLEMYVGWPPFLGQMLRGFWLKVLPTAGFFLLSPPPPWQKIFKTCVIFPNRRNHLPGGWEYL